ncbi:MAG: hypothetical protein KC492_34520 [Myxococcales bacterium]|nr:hypothetical protein [Myxococcales bacterium]
MAIISFRQRLHDLFGDTLDLEQGWRQGTWNEYFRSFPEDYPYRDQDGHISVAAFLDSLLWPSMYTEEQRHPDGVELPYSTRIQGITSYLSEPDALYWIISQNKDEDGRGKLTFLQSILNLVTSDPFRTFEIYEPDLAATKAHHFGDPCVFDNRFILVPYEGTVYPASAPVTEQAPLLVAFEIQTIFDPPNQTTYSYPDSIQYSGYSYLSQQGPNHRQAPWCACYKDFIFSSRFSSLEDDDANLQPEIYLYKITATNPFGIEPRTKMGSEKYKLKKKNGDPINIRRIQGGDISHNGHIYLVSDVKINGEKDANNKLSEGGGIHMFDITTGRQIYHIKIDGHQSFSSYELEGICIRDADVYPRHPLTKGQIHMCVLDVDLRPPDQAWIRHWSTDPNEKQYI